MMMNAKRLLDQYHFNILKDMARLLRVVAPGDKVGHIKALSSILFTPPAVQKGLSLLGKREKGALAAIQRGGGQVRASRLRQQLIRQHVIKPKDKKDHHGRVGASVWGPERRRTSFTAIIGRLMAVGLVCGKGIVQIGYSQRTKIYYDNVQILYIPQEIQSLLPKPPPIARYVFKAENLTRIDESSARAFQRDIYLYWSTVHAAPLSLTQQDRLYKKDLKRINNALLRAEDMRNKDELNMPRLIFLRRLLTDIGILAQKRRTVRAVDHPKFLGQNPTVRIERALAHWRDGTFWNEALSIPGVTVLGAETRARDAPSRIVEARKVVLEHVAALHKDGWIPIEQLIDSLRLADYDFLLPRDYKPKRSSYYYYYGYNEGTPYSAYGNEMGWNFSSLFSGGASLADEAEGWEVVEAGFIRAILLEPLYWMGLVDIGYMDDVPEVYRLTPIAAWVMGLGSKVDIPGESDDQVHNVVVQPNFEIFAMDPISDLVLAKLDEFADRVSAERAIKYVLTRESVYRAQRNKWTSAHIIDTLQKMSDKPLPQNVVRTLEEWQLVHERITIHRQANLLQAVDAELLNRLSENQAVRSYLTVRPGEDVAIVAKPGEPVRDEVQELLRALQEMGYPPARTRDPQDALRPSFTIGSLADGAQERARLRFREALPSVYLFEQIAPFTERDQEGSYFLTRSAIESALKHDLTIDDILSRLHTLHVGPLPRWVEIKIRAWGNYYGNAAVQPLILVQIRDEKTLQELLDEPGLEGILCPFAPSQKRTLAWVSTENLETLCKAFAERGIEINDQLE